MDEIRHRVGGRRNDLIPERRTQPQQQPQDADGPNCRTARTQGHHKRREPHTHAWTWRLCVHVTRDVTAQCTVNSVSLTHAEDGGEGRRRGEEETVRGVRGMCSVVVAGEGIRCVRRGCLAPALAAAAAAAAVLGMAARLSIQTPGGASDSPLASGTSRGAPRVPRGWSLDWALLCSRLVTPPQERFNR